jgi:hypothetical protein
MVDRAWFIRVGGGIASVKYDRSVMRSRNIFANHPQYEMANRMVEYGNVLDLLEIVGETTTPLSSVCLTVKLCGGK